jgi:hypothetical protein
MYVTKKYENKQKEWHPATKPLYLVCVSRKCAIYCAGNIAVNLVRKSAKF